jgi:hypothetical protein
MTIAALTLLFNVKTRSTWVISFFAVTSWPILFAVERGNIDLVVFFLLVFGFYLIERQREEVRAFSSALLIILLTVLKIFPIASVVVLAKNRKGTLAALATACLSVIALILTSGHHLSQILANTPQDLQASYGSYPFFFVMSHHLLPFLATEIQNHHNIAVIGAMILAALSILFGFIVGDRLYLFLPKLDFARASGCIAVSCLAIFCSTFLAGSSYNYRLLFLLGVIAYLVEDMNNGKSLRSLPASIVLLIFLSMPFYRALIHETLDGLVFVVGCAWLSTAMFDRLKTVDEPKLLTTSFSRLHLAEIRPSRARDDNSLRIAGNLVLTGNPHADPIYDLSRAEKFVRSLKLSSHPGCAGIDTFEGLKRSVLTD